MSSEGRFTPPHPFSFQPNPSVEGNGIGMWRLGGCGGGGGGEGGILCELILVVQGHLGEIPGHESTIRVTKQVVLTR